MAPKAASSSSLGPLAKRTFKGPPSNGIGSGSGSASGSASPAPGYGTGAAGPGSSSNPGSASPSRYPSSPSRPFPQSRPSSPPLLLPRHEETSLHRRLRSLLLDFTRQRTVWEEEVLEMGESVGAYATVLGELEEEMAERGLGNRPKGKGKGRAEALKISSAQNRNQVCPAITESFRSLHEIYTRSLLKGRERIERAVEGLVKLKDAARLLQVNWVRLDEEGGLGGEDGEGDVRWGRRGGDEFVDAIFHITLQAQIQTLELLQSLDVLLIDCSPLGSLHSTFLHGFIPDSPLSLRDKGPQRDKYDPATSSAKRKEVLLMWRDLPSLDRGGEGSFEWWKAVWRAEVRGWEES
ncbi:hypothetical protein BCV69DRAFT_106162 [Microstroma glucosiphilum]|uniref:Uncharacterized protein n=1 Tax=Pseudomicrostroma glucosiphilum TaxID=1684307 RepID=A0A316UF51_9BASI|nr:hypothetical protein BCV69DRAFT_106162 [Pseudomicrostroma glucosiphilum]PWN23041.1 hypothetical protein BCV69DRAFT_106162 [Pseudomicrostroma glucosiphilum]